jgi:hypothetical protein
MPEKLAVGTVVHYPAPVPEMMLPFVSCLKNGEARKLMVGAKEIKRE